MTFLGVDSCMQRGPRRCPRLIRYSNIFRDIVNVIIVLSICIMFISLLPSSFRHHYHGQCNHSHLFRHCLVSSSPSLQAGWGCKSHVVVRGTHFLAFLQKYHSISRDITGSSGSDIVFVQDSVTFSSIVGIL